MRHFSKSERGLLLHQSQDLQCSLREACSFIAIKQCAASLAFTFSLSQQFLPHKCAEHVSFLRKHFITSILYMEK